MVCWVGFLLYFTTLLSIRCCLAAIIKGGGKRGRNVGGPQTGKTADTEDESGTGISFEGEEENNEVEDLLLGKIMYEQNSSFSSIIHTGILICILIHHQHLPSSTVQCLLIISIIVEILKCC